ncbi:unnamed protein product [Linum tenue]|uniref:Uncharacterized protein n=1 Tax=Linum tenue TaxID=586396 RepID=A0AAV0R663_9ROSI|nr:unnamed protein product [Linum tenue]
MLNEDELRDAVLLVCTSRALVLHLVKGFTMGWIGCPITLRTRYYTTLSIDVRILVNYL